MKLMTLLIALLLFSGCSIKQEPNTIVKKETICIEQQTYPYGNPIKVRVHPQDLDIHKARTEYLKKGFEFYKRQVERNNKCLPNNKTN